MSKVKKILAMVLAMVMVLGMTVTSFAAESDEVAITINNAENATFEYMQLIKPDNNKETGWTFCDGVFSEYSKGFDGKDEQTVIKMLINKEAHGTYEGIPEASATQIATALNAVKNSSLVKISNSTNEIVVGKINDFTKAGVYYVMGKEMGYTYLPMAAYIKFGEYTEGTPGPLQSTELNAKKTDNVPEKENNNGDATTEIGRTVEYTIRTTVPYIGFDNNSSYTITDKITGADYVLSGDNKLVVRYFLGDDTEGIERNASLSPDKKSFTIDLTDIAQETNPETGDRLNANKNLVIKYSAKVTDMYVRNDVITSDGSNSNIASNRLFAGTATLTKTGENNKPLENAEFVLVKGQKYATFEERSEGTKNVYKLTGWVDDIDDATEVKSDAEGKVYVEGLDGSEQYSFKETQAPDGYSVNQENSPITFTTTTENATEQVEGTNVEYIKTISTGIASMTDTKLSALPSTGGIGTTIFTIGGCAIMIAAAGLFFASRRKSSK